MFDAIKNFVADLASGEKQAGGLGDHDLRVATAALLVHAAAIDGAMSDAERGKLQSLLKQRFELDDAAASELIEQGAAADDKAVDLYHFTHLLNASLDENDRLRMIEMMWTIAYADGAVSEFEDNLIWRVADLLGVSSTERIALRHRVAAPKRQRHDAGHAHHRRVGGHRRANWRASLRRHGHAAGAGGAPRAAAERTGRRDRCERPCRSRWCWRSIWRSPMQPTRIGAALAGPRA